MSRESYNVDNQEQKSLLEGVRVSALCKVTKFDASTMTVDVQPLSKALDGGVYRTPPPVLGVPGTSPEMWASSSMRTTTLTA